MSKPNFQLQSVRRGKGATCEYCGTPIVNEVTVAVDGGMQVWGTDCAGLTASEFTRRETAQLFAEERAAWVAANPELRTKFVELMAEYSNAYELRDYRRFAELDDNDVNIALEIITNVAAERAEEQKRREAALQSRVHAEGTALTVTGTVDRAFGFEGHYGWSRCVVIHDDDGGGEVVVFSTARWASETNEGDRVTLAGTVRSCEPPEIGVPSNTKLARVKRVDDAWVAAERNRKAAAKASKAQEAYDHPGVVRLPDGHLHARRTFDRADPFGVAC